MKNILAAIAVMSILSGCVVASTPYGPYVVADTCLMAPGVEVGCYNPGYGYWTGFSWDIDFYRRGHVGYGRPYYRNHGYNHDRIRGYHH